MTNTILEKYLITHLNNFYLSEEVLLENIQKKMDGIKKAFATKPVEYGHDEHAEFKDNDSIIDHIANKGDPTPKKEYTQWLTKQYSNGKFFQHDLDNDDNFIKSTVNSFNTLKNRKILPEDKRDINKISYEDMHELVNEFSGEKSNKEKKMEVREEALSGATKLLDENGVKVYKTEAGEEGKTAHKILGQGSTWCTAAASNNMYDNYTKSGKNPAPLYVVLDSKKNKKYNFWFGGENGEFADERNIHHNIGHFVKDVPEITKLRDEFLNNSKCGNKSLLVPFYSEEEANDKFQDLVDKPSHQTAAYAENTPSIKHINELYEKVKNKASDFYTSNLSSQIGITISEGLAKNGYTPQHIRDEMFDSPTTGHSLKVAIARNSYNPAHARAISKDSYDYKKVLEHTPSTQVLDEASSDISITDGSDTVKSILRNSKVNNTHRKNMIGQLLNPANYSENAKKLNTGDIWRAKDVYSSAIPSNSHHALDDHLLFHSDDAHKQLGFMVSNNINKLKKAKNQFTDPADLAWAEKHIDKAQARIEATKE